MSRRRQNADEAREPAASDATKLRDVIKWNMRIGPVVYLLFAASNYFLNYAPRMAGVSLTAAILALLILVLHRQFSNRLTANLLICTIAIQVFGEMFVNGGLSAPIAPLVMVIVPAAVIMASPRVAVLWSVFVTIGLAAMALLQAGDLLPPEELSGHARIADQALSIVMGVILIAFVSSIFARQSRMAMRTLAIERYRYQYEASHDSLTGLPNRSHFYEHAEQLLIKARDSGGVFTLLYLDLDGFKKVNDTLGHAAGDHLLIDFADQARQQFDDDCFIATNSSFSAPPWHRLIRPTSSPVGPAPCWHRLRPWAATCRSASASAQPPIRPMAKILTRCCALPIATCTGPNGYASSNISLAWPMPLRQRRPTARAGLLMWPTIRSDDFVFVEQGVALDMSVDLVEC